MNIKILAIVLILILPYKIFSHAKKNKKVFLLNIYPGTKWNIKKTYKGQVNISRHVFFMKQLFNKNKILFATESINGKNNLYVIYGYDKLSDLKAELSKNELIKKKILTYDVTKSILHMEKHLH